MIKLSSPKMRFYEITAQINRSIFKINDKFYMNDDTEIIRNKTYRKAGLETDGLIRLPLNHFFWESDHNDV